MTNYDVNTLKESIFAKAGNKVCTNRMEVTKRVVDTAARYITECYQELERQLEDIMETEQLIKLDPSTNSNIFKSIEEIRVEELEETMDLYDEMIVAEAVPVKDLVRLITTYRYMLTRIIKNKEVIKNKIWEQLQNNKVHQKEVYQQTGPPVREDQHKGEGRMEKNLIPHKINSGKPTELAKGPKNSKEEQLFNGGFQKSTKRLY